jgi:hypothetical protein
MGQLHVLAPQYRSRKTFDGPQNQFGRFTKGEENISFPLPAIELRILDPPFLDLLTVLIELTPNLGGKYF